MRRCRPRVWKNVGLLVSDKLVATGAMTRLANNQYWATEFCWGLTEAMNTIPWLPQEISPEIGRFLDHD